MVMITKEPSKALPVQDFVVSCKNLAKMSRNHLDFEQRYDVFSLPQILFFVILTDCCGRAVLFLEHLTVSGSIFGCHSLGESPRIL